MQKTRVPRTNTRLLNKGSAAAIASVDGVPCVKLVRVGRNSKQVAVQNSDDVYEFWQRVVRRQPWFDEDRECAVVLLLDSKSNLIAWNLVSVGTRNRCFIDVVGVFRVAVAASAGSVVVVHHHPSGDPAASEDDVRSTRVLISAGNVLGVRLDDHVVIGDGTYFCFRGEYRELFERPRRLDRIAADRKGASYAKAQNT